PAFTSLSARPLTSCPLLPSQSPSSSRRTWLSVFLLTLRPRPRPTLFPYTTLFRSAQLGDLSAQPQPTHRLAQVVVAGAVAGVDRSEEHTSELQSRFDLVCRLLLEKKNDQREHSDKTSTLYDLMDAINHTAA